MSPLAGSFLTFFCSMPIMFLRFPKPCGQLQAEIVSARADRTRFIVQRAGSFYTALCSRIARTMIMGEAVASQRRTSAAKTASNPARFEAVK